MISDKMKQLLDSQLNKELVSSYIYLAMSAHCDSIGFEGFAGWLAKQASEEYEHGMKFFKYLQEMQVRPLLKPIPEPRQSYDTLRELFWTVVEHEKSVTASIHEIASLALTEKDHATYSFIKWFIDEQIEEELQSQRLLDRVSMVENNIAGLLALDREAGSRSD